MKRDANHFVVLFGAGGPENINGIDLLPIGGQDLIDGGDGFGGQFGQLPSRTQETVGRTAIVSGSNMRFILSIADISGYFSSLLISGSPSLLAVWSLPR